MKVCQPLILLAHMAVECTAHSMHMHMPNKHMYMANINVHCIYICAHNVSIHVHGIVQFICTHWCMLDRYKLNMLCILIPGCVRIWMMVTFPSDGSSWYDILVTYVAQKNWSLMSCWKVDWVSSAPGWLVVCVHVLLIQPLGCQWNGWTCMWCTCRAQLISTPGAGSRIHFTQTTSCPGAYETQSTL